MGNSEEELPRLLSLVDYSHPILRTKIAPVAFPLSAEDKAVIRDMKYSIQPAQLKMANAPWEAAVGMAANQWGIAKRIFLYCPLGDTVEGLEVVINPSYEVLGGDINQATQWEGCFSVPLATGNIKRHLHIKVTYQNEIGTKISKELTGWNARVWQHENDHLDGHLYDDPRTQKCLEKREFKSLEDLEQFYKTLK